MNRKRKVAEIKTGSNWISPSGEEFTILAIDEDRLFIKYNRGEHQIITKEGLKVFCKPAPIRRTIWLNVYSGFVKCHKDKEAADRYKTGGILFQQEVELIDPRKGE